ncbi:ligand-binding SRPBCC domain-containing protein [Paenibacillus shirakamiensis]|uniref:Ligand-binding SRPBCC domain-containing protein n=1 Tax=Paenibacillus shirakamiensis TaxID=1265935 RepID=A0ABS4JIC4_9BACL|nr:ligand-binding SRPBCC domain-containing protein [Paenibacillus shirakamiensis]
MKRVMQGPIGMGETVTFEATHFGIRQRLTSKITEYDAPRLFVDTMQKGAFKSLRHVHEFVQREDYTLMTDTLYLEAPFGIVGKIAEKAVLQRYMKNFLIYRNRQLKKLIESKGE